MQPNEKPTANVLESAVIFLLRVQPRSLTDLSKFLAVSTSDLVKTLNAMEASEKIVCQKEDDELVYYLQEQFDL